MERLDALASVVRLGERVVRILGQNPGKFTLQGTNTYLVGERAPYVLVDTGEGRPAYIPLLESALQHGDPPQHVSDIVISHSHQDHLGGLCSVLALLRSLSGARPFQPPRIHKWPLPADSTQPHIEPGMYTPSPTGALFHDLRDGQSFPIISSRPDASFRVIHAPGHTQDSIALLFPSENVLYTADTVLGHGTAVFEHLGTYLSTLGSLLSHIDERTVLYPGHGPVVHDGQQALKTYIEHRMIRENQILQVLQQAGASSTWEVVSRVYATYPRDLWEAATGNVDQHLLKLVNEGKVEALGGEGKEAKWKLL